MQATVLATVLCGDELIAEGKKGSKFRDELLQPIEPVRGNAVADLGAVDFALDDSRFLEDFQVLRDR